MSEGKDTDKRRKKAGPKKGTQSKKDMPPFLASLHRRIQTADMDELLEIAGNETTPADVLSVLADFQDLDLRLAVASNPNVDSDTLMLLSNSDSGILPAVVAASKNLPEFIVNACLSDADKKIRQFAASNPSVPCPMLEDLAESDDAWLRLGASENPNSTIEILKSLSEDEHMPIRASVAVHPNTSADILAVLAKDESDIVRLHAMRHVNARGLSGNGLRTRGTSVQSSARLVKADLDTDYSIEESDYIYDPEHRKKPSGGNWYKTDKGWTTYDGKDIKQEHDRRTDEIKQKLDDETLSLSPELASTIGKSMLREMDARQLVKLAEISSRSKNKGQWGNDTDNELVDGMFVTLSKVDENDGLSSAEVNELRLAIARNTDISSYVLDEMASSNQGNDKLLCAIASNPNVTNDMDWAFKDSPKAIMNYYANPSSISGRKPMTIGDVSEDEYVKALDLEPGGARLLGLAMNPDTPHDFLMEMFFENVEHVGTKIDSFLLANPSFSEDELDIIWNRTTDKKLRSGIVKNPNAPSRMLDEISTSDDKNVRKQVAEHPNTSNETLSKMLADTDKDVLVHVRFRLGLPDIEDDTDDTSSPMPSESKTDGSDAVHEANPSTVIDFSSSSDTVGPTNTTDMQTRSKRDKKQEGQIRKIKKITRRR